MNNRNFEVQSLPGLSDKVVKKISCGKNWVISVTDLEYVYFTDLHKQETRPVTWSRQKNRESKVV